VKKVNLLLVRYLEKQYVDQISSLDPRLEVFDHSDPDPKHLGEYLPVNNKNIQDAYNKAEIILAYKIPTNLLELAPNLKWLQLSSAGIEHLGESILKSHIKISNTVGIHGIAMAEHIIMFMLMFLRKALNLLDWKDRHVWNPYYPGELRGRRIGIIGLGHIGLEVASAVNALGMKILVTDLIFPDMTKGVAGIETTYPPHLLKEMLSKSDFVVITVPLTKKTEGLIGEEELRSMRKSAYIINVSRGPIIDEKALIKALEGGWIAGAGLDVFSTEPLPPDNRLWDLPNVIISPHVAGVSDQHDKRLTDLFCGNILRYFNGEHLLNVVKE
jgi:phosphoglycerate dehydrogenase-like enzyme